MHAAGSFFYRPTICLSPLPQSATYLSCCQFCETVIRIQRMKFHLSHPTREVELQGPKRVSDIFKELQLIPEAFLVIRGRYLMTEDEIVADSDSIEVRPVISGG